jgi:hypothetical protein
MHTYSSTILACWWWKRGRWWKIRSKKVRVDELFMINMPRLHVGKIIKKNYFFMNTALWIATRWYCVMNNICSILINIIIYLYLSECMRNVTICMSWGLCHASIKKKEMHFPCLFLNFYEARHYSYSHCSSSFKWRRLWWSNIVITMIM